MKPYIENNRDLKKDYYPTMMVSIANSYFYTGNRKGALESIDELINYEDLDDFTKNVTFSIKEYYLGNFLKALEYFTICHNLMPDNIGTNQNLKTLYELQKGQYELKALNTLSSLGTYKFSNNL
ncbi:MAG: hypothetical protein WCR55_14800 [Lentisphaerota bacterium]